jgi:hypothetical protein
MIYIVMFAWIANPMRENLAWSGFQWFGALHLGE